MRLIITTLSMLSVISFGYALAGYGGTLFGQAIRTDYVVLGLSAGFLTGGLAMWLWYKHRDEFFLSDEESKESKKDNAGSKNS